LVNKSSNKIELYPLGEIKDVFIKTLYKNELIQEMMLGENNEDLNTYDIEDIMRGSKELGLEGIIRNSLFIDTTQTETKTFILMESFVGKIENNKFKTINVIMNIFCHNSLLTLSNTEKAKFYNLGFCGNRIDCLIDQVSRCINGRTDIGIGQVNLSPNTQGKIIQPNTNYYGKTLLFEVWDF
jgi:hypothetical protein